MHFLDTHGFRRCVSSPTYSYFREGTWN